MKRAASFLIPAALAAAILGWAGIASPGAPPRSLAADMPRGALLYLQAKDFSGLLRQWNASPVKQAWLKSENYAAFSRSKLLLRLQSAQREFAAAAGVPPDAKFLSQAAGSESALAIYDIGKLQFLYISRLPSARSMQSALWQSRAKFQARSAAGATFFVHADPQSGRVAAFAVTGDYLLLATREDLIAGALDLLAGGTEPALIDDPWYREATAAAGAPGDLRLVLDMKKVAATPHFRSYWIQRNVSELRRYQAAISDLHLDGLVYREDRVLLRKAPAPPSPNLNPQQSVTVSPAARQVASLLRLVPSNAGFYRAVANPGPEKSLDLLKTGILFPHTGPAPASTFAPGVDLTGGVVGQSSDLETRIDVPPPVIARGGNGWEPLGKLLRDADVQASLLVESTEENADTAFIGRDAVVVLAAKGGWNPAAVRAALTAAIRQEVTTAGLGSVWKEEGTGHGEYSTLDGLLPVAVAVRGNELFLSSRPVTLAPVLARLKTAPTAAPATYAAGFRHPAETKNFLRLTSALDSPLRYRFASPSGFRGQPPFFSGNVASLSRVLSAVVSESIVVHDSPRQTRQTVTYHWSR